MATSTLGSILLGTTNPERLRDWYAAALAPGDGGGGFTEVTPTMFACTFGDTSLLIDGRSDPRTAPRNAPSSLMPGPTAMARREKAPRHGGHRSSFACSPS